MTSLMVCMGPLLLWSAYKFLVYRPFRAKYSLPKPGLLGALFRTT